MKAAKLIATNLLLLGGAALALELVFGNWLEQNPAKRIPEIARQAGRTHTFRTNGANIGDKAAIFEATHGTAPKHAGLDKINPGSVILSGVMMLEFMGWQKAADLITKGLSGAIEAQKVTYDLARLMEPPVEPLRCSGFADAVIEHF